MKHTAILLMPLALLLAACAGIPRDLDDPPPLERYLAHAGEPVERVSYPVRLHGWHPVDRHHLVIQTSPTGSYLLTVASGCMGLQHATSIGLTSRTARSVIVTGMDSVVLANERCRIIKIRPLDEAVVRGSPQRDVQ